MSINGPTVYNLTFLSAAAKYLARSYVSAFVLAYSFGRMAIVSGKAWWKGCGSAVEKQVSRKWRQAMELQNPSHTNPFPPAKLHLLNSPSSWGPSMKA